MSQIGPYEILRELGRGGMGEINCARRDIVVLPGKGSVTRNLIGFG